MSPKGGQRKGAGRPFGRTQDAFVGLRLSHRRKAWLDKIRENGHKSISSLVRELLDISYPLDERQ